MLVKLVKVDLSTNGQSSLKEIYVNTNHIAAISEVDDVSESVLIEKQLLGFMKDVTFSRIVIVEGNRTRTITVVGAPIDIYQKINKKQILRG